MRYRLIHFILFAVLASCAVTDVRNGRIPNVLLGLGAAAGAVCVLGLHWRGGGLQWRPAAMALFAYGGRMALTGMLGFPFFVFRMTGAGDIKLLALIMALLGWEKGTAAAAAGFCLGAVLALAKMLRHGAACQRFLYLAAYIRRFIQSKKIEPYYCPERDGNACVIPMGACFFAGALLAAL